MKILPILFAALLHAGNVHSQAPKMCCSPSDGASATAQFAALASAEGFAQAHPLPRATNEEAGQTGTMKTIDVADGKSAAVYVVEPRVKTNKYILVFQEWWGLNDHIKSEADRLFNAMNGEVLVMAPDLYDGKVATTREAAGALMQGADEKRLRAIIAAVGEQIPQDAQVATIGWCFGGGWSLQTAIMLNNKVDACVMYYGMPEQNKDELKKLNADVLGIFASMDGWITPEVANKFEISMNALGKDIEIMMYEADHAFANPSNPGYNEGYAADAHERAVKFIRERID